jgi:hypothetical protein
VEGSPNYIVDNQAFTRCQLIPHRICGRNGPSRATPWKRRSSSLKRPSASHKITRIIIWTWNSCLGYIEKFMEVAMTRSLEVASAMVGFCSHDRSVANPGHWDDHEGWDHMHTYTCLLANLYLTIATHDSFPSTVWTPKRHFSTNTLFHDVGDPVNRQKVGQCVSSEFVGAPG